MKRALLLCMLLAAAPFPAFAQGTADAPLRGKLLITGSSTMAPLVGELGKRFRTRHPGLVISVEANGSERGAADVLEGRADIGMASRELNAQEQALFAILIARDGMVPVVHRDNRVTGITRAQVGEMFNGTLDNWKRLGGAAAPIDLVERTPGYSLSVLLDGYVKPGPVPVRIRHAARDNPEAVAIVAASRNALAFLTFGYVERSIRNGTPVKILTLDGIAPTRPSMLDGTWPLSRPLSLLTRRVPAGAAKAFIEFALSSAAGAVILEYDFVPYLN